MLNGLSIFNNKYAIIYLVMMFDYEKEHLEKIYPYLAECTLFLKKDDSFPLDKPCSIAAYGCGVRGTIKGGTGSGDVNSRFFINIEQGLISRGFKVNTSNWLDAYQENRNINRKAWIKQVRKEAHKAHKLAPVYGMGMVMPEPEYDLPLSFTSEACIYVVSRISGEGNDRRAIKGDVLLTDSEIRDILILNQKYQKFMLVINAGGVIDLSPVLEVKNILILSELGVETGHALADILLGKLNPSGKLTATWARLDDYPYSLKMNIDDSPYSEGVYVGYRYFDSFNKPVLFPFGFGLSYSNFELNNYKVSNDKETISIKVDVKNISKHPGKEVVQAYISILSDEDQYIKQELIAFNKTKELKENEVQTLELSFKLSSLARYDAIKGLYYLPKGKYLVKVGNCSRNTVSVAEIALNEQIVVKEAIKIFSHVEVEELHQQISETELNKDYGVPVIKLTNKDFELYKPNVRQVDIPLVIDSLTDEQLAKLNVGYHNEKPGFMSVVGEASDIAPGAAGQAPSLYKELFNDPIVMSDGPAGLRLCPSYYIDKKGKHIGIEVNKIMLEAFDFLPSFISKIAKLFIKDKKVKNGTEIHYQYTTAIPIGTAIAQSFNLEFAQLCGDIVGDEMERFNIDLWLAPALNIHKNILCGRNFEYYSEDPIVSGLFASALTKGVQAHKGKGVTIKHFAANNQETNRYANNSIVSEKILREIYLRGFEIAINQSNPMSVMSSYNLINGDHSSENRNLINEFLFNENGYQGFVMTDWVVTGMNSKKDKYRAPLGHLIANSGTSLMMPGRKMDVNDILQAIKVDAKLKEQIKINIARMQNARAK